MRLFSLIIIIIELVLCVVSAYLTILGYVEPAHICIFLILILSILYIILHSAYVDKKYVIIENKILHEGYTLFLDGVKTDISMVVLEDYSLQKINVDNIKKDVYITL